MYLRLNSSNELESGFYNFNDGFHYPTTYTPQIKKWYYLATTVDGTNLTFYINGETYSSIDISTAQKPSSSGSGYFIGKKWDDNTKVDADISIIKVWNGSLTYSTINQTYNSLLDRFYYVLNFDPSNWDGSASNVIDTRNGLSGTVSGIGYSPTYGGVLSFVDQSYINFGNPEPLNQNGDISFFIWTKFTSFTTAYNVLAKHYGGGQNDFLFSVKDFNGSGIRKMNFYTQNNYGVPGNEYAGLFDTTEINLNTWYLLGFTLQNNGNLTYYVNGNTSSVFNNVNRFAVNNDFVISSADSNDGITGYVGQFKFYNRVLTDTEVLDFYTNTQERYNPTPGSLIFNSSNHTYLSGTLPYIIGTGSFTVELWAKSFDPDNGGSLYSGLISFRVNESFPAAISLNLSSGSLEAFCGNNTYQVYSIDESIWNHIAMVRNNSSLVSTYINGICVGTFSEASQINVQDFVIGKYWTNYNAWYFNGLITNIRFNSNVVYTSNFTPQLEKLTADEYTKLLIPVDSSNLYNDLSNNLTIQQFNGVGFTSSLPHLPYGSYRFGLNDTTTRYISIPASNDWAVGYNDFTVEWFQYQTQASPPGYSRLFQVGEWPNQSFAVSIESGTFLLWLNNGMTYYVGLGLSNYINQWVHFAVSRVSGQVSVWQNGTRIWTGTINTNITNNTNNLQIGYGSGNVWNGYVTNFRLITGNGNSIYNPNSATITVPTSTLTNVTGTKLLLLFEGANSLIDSSPYNRTITNYGATWSNLTPF